jgi:hypothetical protein
MAASRRSEVASVNRILMLGLFGATLAFAAAPPEDPRLPLPAKEEIAKTEKVVKELFRVDYAKTKATDRSAFAKTLLENGEKSDEEAGQYVFFREARDVAARAGDVSVYFAAAKELVRTFRISDEDACAGGIDLLAASLALNGASAENASLIIEKVDAAVRAGNFAAAQKLVNAADVVSRRAAAPAVVVAAASRVKGLPALRLEFDKLPDAEKKLENSPQDKKANLLVGRFQCFVKNDWETGLGRLLLGADGTLRATVDKDLAAKSGSAFDRVQAGDQWHKFAASTDPFQKFGLEARAVGWYIEAVPELTGLEKMRVEKLIADLGPPAVDFADLTRQMNDPKSWRAAGKWTYDGKTAEGDNAAVREFLGKLPDNCVIQFRMGIKRGIRSQIWLGDRDVDSYFFGCDGKFPTPLKFHGKPIGDVRGADYFIKYGDTIKVKFEFKKERVTVWINDMQTVTAKRELRGLRLKLVVGTKQHKGTTSYSEFQVSASGG